MFYHFGKILVSKEKLLSSSFKLQEIVLLIEPKIGE